MSAITASTKKSIISSRTRSAKSKSTRSAKSKKRTADRAELMIIDFVDLTLVNDDGIVEGVEEEWTRPSKKKYFDITAPEYDPWPRQQRGVCLFFRKDFFFV